MSDARRRAAWAWLAVALWTALVWTLSSDAFSAQSTSRILGPIVRWLWPGVEEATLAWIHFAARKGAHVAEYAVLGALVLRAARLGSRGPHWRAAILAVGFAASVASADELRQARSSRRTGAPADVMLDTAGAGLGVAAALAAAHVRRTRRRPAAPARAAVSSAPPHG